MHTLRTHLPGRASTVISTPAANRRCFPRSRVSAQLLGGVACCSFVSCRYPSLSAGPVLGLGRPLTPRNAQSRSRLEKFRIGGADSLAPLGFELLSFLTATVVLIPLFKRFSISPVLGFLFGGVVLQQLGWIQDKEGIEKLSELGVLFLLFEMGLELSLDRLKALAKYAFGMGTLQMVGCTLIFTACALPVNSGVATQFLEIVAHSPASLVSIRSVDEAVVIGGALSMSSSAFVLQLLQEKGEMTSKRGSATLGILLLQDIAVVPFLVLLPLLHSGVQAGNPISLLEQLGPTAFQTVAGLGALLLGGRLMLRRVFEIVAQSNSNETFVALCLLTVTGASLATKQLGFSDTLGAFIAGVLLAETSYRTQVEADIRPFKGLLLGLFFATTGASINMNVFMQNWQTVLWMLGGLLLVKTSVIATLGPNFGLTRSESIRTGFLLSQGGEFAFVLLSLASQLKILPENLNQLLIVVVVLSMAVTPALSELGKYTADALDKAYSPSQAAIGELEELGGSDKCDDPVVILGFGPQAQMLVNMLGSPLYPRKGGQGEFKYLAFDLDPGRVRASREAGFSVIFGDGSRASVLRAAGVKTPKAFVVCSGARVQSVKAVELVHNSFPDVPIYACAIDLRHAAELTEAGAGSVVIASKEAGMTLGQKLLLGLGNSQEVADYLKRSVEEALRTRTEQLSKLSVQAPEEQIFVLDHQLQLQLAEVAASNSKGSNGTSQRVPVPTAILSMELDSDEEVATVGMAVVDIPRQPAECVDKDDFDCDNPDEDDPCCVSYDDLAQTPSESVLASAPANSSARSDFESYVDVEVSKHDGDAEVNNKSNGELQRKSRAAKTDEILAHVDS